MRRRLPIIGLGLLIGLAVLILALDAAFPYLLDPRNLAAWRRHRAEVVPMPFFAKIVDERGQPIEGARITLRLILHSDAMLLGQPSSKDERVVLTTDAQGSATLDGYEGLSIYVLDVHKPGHRWFYDADLGRFKGRQSTDMMDFSYGRPTNRYVADPDNPAVFPLYREDITQPEPEVGSAALPSRGGFTNGVRGMPFVPYASTLEDSPLSRMEAERRRSLGGP